MRRAEAVALAAFVLAVGCRRTGVEGDAAGPHAEARALVEEGQYDAALARLGGDGDPEALYLLGRAWAGKAGPPRPGGGLGPEEQQALDFFGRATAADPGHARAHRAIGDLLAPHALAEFRARAAAPKKGASPSPVGPEASVDRVLRAYGEALQADLEDTGAVTALIAFATETERLREAEAGFEELVRRDREDPDVLVRFGDFLAGPRGDPDGALARYAQALIWRPDDTATRLKMARLHLDAAQRHLEQREYPAAEGRLRDARRFVVDPASPEAAQMREVEANLAEVRGRR